jgi:hypothetical protein
MENQPPVILKNTVELPAKTYSVAMGQTAATSRVVMTEATRMGSFAENAHLLSDKPLRRIATRRLS